MIWLFLLFIIILIPVLIVVIIYATKKPNNNRYTIPPQPNIQNTIGPQVPPVNQAVPNTLNNDNSPKVIYPYNRKYLLTKNEWNFYRKIKPIIDKNNMHILAKVRLADLIEVRKGLEYGEQQKWFAKIRSKHIDFVICNPENLQILFLIELQDSSHNKADRIERDNFVNSILDSCGYKICWINNDSLISEKLQIFINTLNA